MTPDRKEKILLAAKTCFSKYGFDKTTLDDIGEMVGMNKVSLYYYFKNKETIFTEVAIREADENSAILIDRVQAIQGCKAKLMTWIEEGFKFNHANSLIHQLTLDTLKKLTPQLEELKASAFKKGVVYLTAILKSGQENNELIDCDIQKVAQTIQTVIYAIKESTYMRAKAVINGTINLATMTKEIQFTVALIIDGITKR